MGKIPLGIELIVGQMSHGKNRGQIYNELEGYPSMENVADENEKKKILSDYIAFSFKDMYETLSKDHQFIFKIITALQKNKKRNDENVSFELLMSIANMGKYDLEKIIDDLMDSKLITQLDSDEYSIEQNAINFVRQYYEDFEEIEDDVIGLKNKIVKHVGKQDKIDIFIEKVKLLLEDNKFDEAEQSLLKAIDVSHDNRLYFELAKVQRVLNKYGRASDNYKIATEFNPKNITIWYDWINMEDSRKRHNVALQIIERALERTNNDISIVKQKINIYKYKKDYKTIRKEIEKYLNEYDKEKRKDDYMKLLRDWKTIEYNLYKENVKNYDEYVNVTELLILKETDKETRLNLLREELKIVQRKNSADKIKNIRGKILSIENSIKKSVGTRVKQLNCLFNKKQYEAAKKEARKILNWIDENDDRKYFINSLRVLLTILAIEKDYDRIIITFEDFKEIGFSDKSCIDIYNKSIKEKEQSKKDDLIKEISFNIQNSELEIRNIIMWVLDYDEESLIKLIMLKDKKEWIDQWQLARNKALKSDGSIIHYSDLGHLRSIFQWCRNDILNKGYENKRYFIKEQLKKIIAYLENYISQERNETFHSRLQLYNIKELNNVLVDTRRLLKVIFDVKNSLEIKDSQE